MATCPCPEANEITETPEPRVIQIHHVNTLIHYKGNCCGFQ